MDEKYEYNGRQFTRQQIEAAAKQSGVTFDAYISKAGIKPVKASDAPEYEYNGKKFSKSAIESAAKQSGITADEYISKVGIKSLSSTEEVATDANKSPEPSNADIGFGNPFGNMADAGSLGLGKMSGANDPTQQVSTDYVFSDKVQTGEGPYVSQKPELKKTSNPKVSSIDSTVSKQYEKVKKKEEEINQFMISSAGSDTNSVKIKMLNNELAIEKQKMNELVEKRNFYDDENYVSFFDVQSGGKVSVPKDDPESFFNKHISEKMSNRPEFVGKTYADLTPDQKRVVDFEIANRYVLKSEIDKYQKDNKLTKEGGAANYASTTVQAAISGVSNLFLGTIDGVASSSGFPTLTALNTLVAKAKSGSITEREYNDGVQQIIADFNADAESLNVSSNIVTPSNAGTSPFQSLVTGANTAKFSGNIATELESAVKSFNMSYQDAIDSKELPFESVSDDVMSATAEMRNRIDFMKKQVFHGDDWVAKTGTFATTTVPQALGYLGGLVGVGMLGPVATMTISRLSQAGSMYRDALESGQVVTGKDLTNTVLAGNAVGVLDMVPVEKFLGSIKFLDNVVSSPAASKFIGGGTVEMFQEAAQTIGENIAAKEFYDSNREVMTGVVEASLAGFLIGGTMDVALGGYRKDGVSKEDKEIFSKIIKENGAKLDAIKKANDSGQAGFAINMETGEIISSEEVGLKNLEDGSIQDHIDESVLATEPEQLRSVLDDLSDGDGVEYQGIHGDIKKTEDGFFVQADDGQMILIEGGENPDATLEELGVKPLPGISFAAIRSATAQRENNRNIDGVEYNGEKYYVSLDSTVNPNGVGDRVFKYNKDGSMTEVHYARGANVSKKMAIINTALQKVGLDKRVDNKPTKIEKEVEEKRSTIEKGTDARLEEDILLHEFEFDGKTYLAEIDRATGEVKGVRSNKGKAVSLYNPERASNMLTAASNTYMQAPKIVGRVVEQDGVKKTVPVSNETKAEVEGKKSKTAQTKTAETKTDEAKTDEPKTAQTPKQKHTAKFNDDLGKLERAVNRKAAFTKYKSMIERVNKAEKAGTISSNEADAQRQQIEDANARARKQHDRDTVEDETALIKALKGAKSLSQIGDMDISAFKKIYDGAIDVAIRMIKAGMKINDAIKEAVAFMAGRGLAPNAIKAIEDKIRSEIKNPTNGVYKPRNTKELEFTLREVFGLSTKESKAAARVINFMGNGYVNIGMVDSIEEYYEEYLPKMMSGEIDAKSFSQNEKELMNAEVINGFYSPIEKKVLASKQKKFSAKKWMEILGKTDEAKYTGVYDMLAAKKPDEQVGRDEIMQWMKDNRIEIREVVKGTGQRVLVDESETPDFIDDAIVDYERGDISKTEFEQVLEGSGYFANYKNNGKVESIESARESDTKHSGHQLKGEKSNYKEVLVTLPSKQKPKTLVESLQAEKSQFKSSHFDEPNILVHLRMNIRTSATGAKVLFLEEIQSDWAQKGRRDGFGLTKEGKRYLELKDREKKLEEKFKNKYGDDWIDKIDEDEHEDYYKYISEKVSLSGSQYNTRTPEAPFVTDTNAWVKLGLKVAMQHAVREGATKIAWTTGEQQNERYDLSKVIKSISAEIKGTAASDGAPMYRITSKYKSGEETAGSYRAEELEGIVGKELAEKIIANKGGSYEGVDLQVGGKGMKGFYGSPTEGSKGIVGSVAESLTGQKVGEVNLSGTKESPISVDEAEQVIKNGGRVWWIAQDESQIVSNVQELRDLNDESYGTVQFFARNTNSIQNSIDITPELQSQVEAGLPLFQNRRAAYYPSQRVISAITNPDVSSPIHEVSHAFFDDLLKHMQLGNDKAWEVYNEFLEFAGSAEGKKFWDAKNKSYKFGNEFNLYDYQFQQEFFAHGLEQRLKDGVSTPSGKLNQFFDMIKNMFEEIYSGMMAGNLSINLSSSAVKMYDKLLGLDADIDPNFTASMAEAMFSKPDSLAQLVDSKKIASVDLINIALGYMKDNKVKTQEVSTTREFPASDIDMIAKNHESAVDRRKDKNVIKSYEAFMDETMKMYNLLVENGYKIEPWMKDGEPYGVDSALMRKDVIENKHLFYLRSRSQTGDSEQDADAKDYPLFRETGVVINGDPVLYNDMFRAVHDIFGHAAIRNSFSTQGEFDAYLTHSNMYSEEAQSALFLETVVYNAYYSKNRKYAPRKMYLIPDVTISRMRGESLVNNTGTSQKFFSDVVTGRSEKFKPIKNWSPLLSFSPAQKAFNKIYSKFNGNFDSHISTSIPMFRDAQVAKGVAIANVLSNGGTVLDIAGSEGGLLKALNEYSGGKIKGINLDVNQDMRFAHESNPVDGVEFVSESFLQDYNDEGIVYKKHVPKKKVDVVHESMGFQFMSPQRELQISEVAQNYLKEDGLFIVEQKMGNSMWNENEVKKDLDFKSKYYTPEQIEEKNKTVSVSDFDANEGMAGNMVLESRLQNALSKNFKYVMQYWDAGNFKGYIATNSKKKADAFMSSVGSLNSEFSNRKDDNLVSIKNGVMKGGVSTKEVVAKLTPFNTEGIKETKDAKLFSELLEKSRQSGNPEAKQVNSVPEKEAQAIIDNGGKLFLAEDNSMGAYIKSDGYMGGMFKLSKRPGAVMAMFKHLEKNGGTFMASYATYLVDLYIKNGYRVAARLKYQGDAEAGTTLESNPDVVLYVKNIDGSEAKNTDGIYFESWDDAYAYTRDLSTQNTPSGLMDNKPQSLGQNELENVESTAEALKKLNMQLSVDSEFEKIKNSKFSSYPKTIGYIYENWDSVKKEPNDNIKTVSSLISGNEYNPVVIDEKGLADGYHRILAAKISGLKNIDFVVDDESFDINEPFAGDRYINISKAYHKAKSDGSNPELVDAVEKLVGNKPQSLGQNSVEINNIVETAKKNGTYLKAPNGKKTNLTPYQWALVRTKNFKNWFGDWENNPKNASKVVDGNGEPRVVYHGTTADFDVFDIKKGTKDSGLLEYGSYFAANKELANIYADFENGSLIPVFLNVRTIQEFDGEGGNGVRAWDKLTVDAGYKIASNRDAMLFIRDGRFGVEKKEAVVAKNIADIEIYGPPGYAKAKEVMGDVYLVFDTTTGNVKSATGNTGVFDSKKPDMLAQGAAPDSTYGLNKKQWNELISEIATNLKGNIDPSVQEIETAIDNAIAKLNPPASDINMLRNDLKSKLSDPVLVAKRSLAIMRKRVSDMLKGVRDEKARMKDIQDQLEDWVKSNRKLINDSDISLTASMIKRIKGVKDQKTLDATIQYIEDLINDAQLLAYEQERAKIVANIRALFNPSKYISRNDSGVLTGKKIDSDTIELVKRIHDIIDASRTAALADMAKIQDEIMYGIQTSTGQRVPMTPEQLNDALDQLFMLQFQGVEDMDISEAQAALDAAKTLIDNGKAAFDAKKQARIRVYSDNKTNALKEITGNRKRRRRIDQPESGPEKISEMQRLLTGEFQDFVTVLDSLASGSKAGASESFLAKIGLRWTHKEADMRAYVIDSSKELLKVQKRFLGRGIKSNLVFMRKLNGNAVKRAPVTFTNAAGEAQTVELTRNQIMYDWGVYQNPDSRRNIKFKIERTDPVTGNVTVVEEVAGADFYAQIDNMLTADEKAYVTWLIDDFFPRQWAPINEVYERNYGVKLGKFYKYLPTKVSSENRQDAAQFDIVDVFSMAGVTPGQIKARIPHNKSLVHMDINEVVTQYVTQTASFVYFADIYKELTRLFFDGDVVDAIDSYHTKAKRLLVQSYIKTISDKNTAGWVYGIFDRIRRNVSLAALAAKAPIMLYQIASSLSYVTQMPGAAKFKYPIKILEGAFIWTDKRKQIFNKMVQSPYFKQRYEYGSSWEVMEQLMTGKGATKSKWKKGLMLATTVGDVTSQIFGGYPVYEHYYEKAKKAGFSEDVAHKIAGEKWAEATDATQQSNLTARTGVTDLGNSSYKWFTMFASQPRQINRLVASQYRLWKDGRVGAAEAVTNAIILHALVPTIIQLIANGFSWDDDDQLRAALLGNLNAVLIFGDIVEASYMMMIQGKGLMDSGGSPAVDWMWEIADDLGDVVKNYSDYGMSPQTTNAGIQTMLGILGIAVPFPSGQATNVLSAQTETDPKKKTARYAGWSTRINKTDNALAEAMRKEMEAQKLEMENNGFNMDEFVWDYEQRKFLLSGEEMEEQRALWKQFEKNYMKEFNAKPVKSEFYWDGFDWVKIEE